MMEAHNTPFVCPVILFREPPRKVDLLIFSSERFQKSNRIFEQFRGYSVDYRGGDILWIIGDNF